MKKIATIAAAVLMLTATATNTFALQPDGSKITGMEQSLSVGYSGGTYIGEIAPQDKRVEHIYLYDTMFTWDQDATSDEATLLTASQMRAAKLSVRSSNNKAVKNITVNASKSRIEIEFVDEHVSVKELDFDMDITLSMDGRQYRDYSMNLSGTLANPVIEVGKYDDAVDISDGVVAEATESAMKAEFEIGSGITVTTRLSKNQKYYGTATNTPTASDNEIMSKHKAIEEVLTLKTVNLKANSTTVSFDDVYRSYHVYDGDLKYLGKASEKLAYSDKYYLASSKLDLEEEAEDSKPAEASEPSDTTEPVTPTASAQTAGTANAAPQNANHNPGTGR